jgi:hypothetical protein
MEMYNRDQLADMAGMGMGGMDPYGEMDDEYMDAMAAGMGGMGGMPPDDYDDEGKDSMAGVEF